MPGPMNRMAGQKLAAVTIPQGHPTGYPIYRLEWQTLGSLKRRLRGAPGRDVNHPADQERDHDEHAESDERMREQAIHALGIEQDVIQKALPLCAVHALEVGEQLARAADRDRCARAVIGRRRATIT